MITVGVTGHRSLLHADEDRLRQAVSQVLGTVVEEAARHTGASVSPKRTAVVVLSALAEGADRLVTEEALARGLPFDALLPFPVAEYLLDFPSTESRGHFRRLLGEASSVIELPGIHDTDTTRSSAYHELGGHLVQGADLLVAVWDGEPARGAGGTQAVVMHSRHSGRPVVWIEAAAPHRVAWLDCVGEVTGRNPAAASALGSLASRLPQREDPVVD